VPGTDSVLAEVAVSGVGTRCHVAASSQDTGAIWSHTRHSKDTAAILWSVCAIRLDMQDVVEM